jgi:CheY-like chemotaxis protein
LLFNTVKHAQVSEARVRVRSCGGYICLSVSDRGRGFDRGKLRETAGFGLLSIRERVELLGGRMKIRSAPGKGSTFFVVAPSGEATNGREAVDLAGQLRPDVVVMDVLMPVMGGEEATRRIKKDLPRTRIVSLSMREEPEVWERMREAGAESYVLKTAPNKKLLAAIWGKESDA